MHSQCTSFRSHMWAGPVPQELELHINSVLRSKYSFLHTHTTPISSITRSIARGLDHRRRYCRLRATTSASSATASTTRIPSTMASKKIIDFLTLPFELRLMVYDHIFDSKSLKFHVEVRSDDTAKGSLVLWDIPPITAVSRMLRDETLPIVSDLPYWDTEDDEDDYDSRGFYDFYGAYGEADSGPASKRARFEQGTQSRMAMCSDEGRLASRRRRGSYSHGRERDQ
ncbi:hypothetical protein EJ03DRAFT_29997 [Teratosphaeria nubilosa]|uniref:F-box domain-containing protein n=1 Tax=Teratosphaeria nubilosa TaxID=161662 RepID=A0A6G1LH30_9PEZI|nr:hypothetical protein EJ03DRAFT_29997 [Teratosphaeria nubilosa]